MSDMVIRDPEEMIKFARDTENYIDDVQSACNQLKSVINASSTLMRDDKGREAVESIISHLDAILSDLPSAEEIADALKRAASHLLEIENIRMR